MSALYIYIIFEIVNAEELSCQLRDSDDEFDGYNHYTISFFSTFTSLEFFLGTEMYVDIRKMCLKRK